MWCDVRVLGAIGVVQLDRPVDVRGGHRGGRSAGVWLRPFRDLVYTMPPYVCSAADLAMITDGVLAATRHAHPGVSRPPRHGESPLAHVIDRHATVSRLLAHGESTATPR